MPILDLRTLEAENIGDNAAALIVEERQTPFDLSMDPLIRIKLLRLTDEINFLLVTMHHIVSDEWSMRIFQRELIDFYQSFSLGCETAVSTPSIQCADFASWEVQLLGNGLLDKQLNYWRKQFSGLLPQLQFTKGPKSRRTLSLEIKRKRLEFGKTVSAAIKTLSSQEKVTPFVVVLSVLNVFFHLWTGQQDIRVGTLVANRALKESEGVIGHFVNTIVVRTTVDPTMTMRQVIKSVRTVFVSALANQELPFEYLARVLEKEEAIERSSLFQVLLNYHDWSFETAKLPGVTFASFGWRQPGSISDLALTACDLVFDIRATATKFTGYVNYKSATVGNDVVTDIIPGFGRILERMVLDAGETVSSIS